MITHEDYLKAKETIDLYLFQLKTEVSDYNTFCYKVDEYVKYKDPSYSFLEKIKEGSKIQKIKSNKNGLNCWTLNKIYVIDSIDKTYDYDGEFHGFVFLVTDDNGKKKSLTLDSISKYFRIVE